MADGSIDKGMFDFNQVMKEFYNYKPDKDDTEGRAIKNNFQANMVQSGFDAQLAKEMAQQQSSIAQSNMITAADLEARNTSSNMEQEFNYGMQSMGAQFEFQDKFADNQYDRDLGTLGATGEQQRLTQSNQGAQDRLTETVRGEQAKGLASVQGDYGNQQANIAADANKYGADATKEASKYQSDASVTNTERQAQSQDKQTQASIQNTQTQADASIQNTQTQADADRFGATTAADASKYSSDASKDASMYGSDKTLEGTKYNADATIRNTTETGKQQRETMSLADQLEASKANRQSARSRTMARSF
jgi:hypothetical protein